MQGFACSLEQLVGYILAALTAVSSAQPVQLELTSTPSELQVALLTWLAVLFANLGYIAEAFLTPTMERVSSALSLPPRLAGVTLLAWANGAPDVSANVAAMRAKRVDMALGSALGAGMFVTCLVGGQLARICNGIHVGGAMVCFTVPRSTVSM
jgi:uncharacterized membrane protein YfcA